MSYTKGEWKVEDGSQVVSGKRLVANTGGFSTNYSSEREENVTNAHLISAAPEMITLLQSLYEHFESGYIANDCVRADRLRRKLELRIKEVIAKAEGK